MRRSRALPRGVLALALSLAGGSAAASPQPLEGVPRQAVWLPGTNAAATVCNLGVMSLATSSDVICYTSNLTDPTCAGDPAPDVFYTRLDLSSCPPCSTGTYANVTAVHLGLFFPSAPETVTVTLSIFYVQQSDCPLLDPPGFPNPDRFDLIAPFQQKLAEITGPFPIVDDFAIPLPSEVHLQPDLLVGQRVYLRCEFSAVSDTVRSHKPRIALQANKLYCVSYNPPAGQTNDYVGFYDQPNPIMFADVQDCVTETRRHTWGELKILYR